MPSQFGLVWSRCEQLGSNFGSRLTTPSPMRLAIAFPAQHGIRGGRVCVPSCIMPSTPRRFPPPGSAELQPNYYVVRDANRITRMNRALAPQPRCLLCAPLLLGVPYPDFDWCVTCKLQPLSPVVGRFGAAWFLPPYEPALFWRGFWHGGHGRYWSS